MKQLLYFLIGFCLVFVPLNYLYASECLEIDGTALNTGNNHFHGFYESSEAAQAAGEAACHDWVGSCATLNAYGSNGSIGTSDGSPVLVYWARFLENAGGGAETQYHYYAYHSDYIECVGDSDGDGIPDDCDYYPNDSEPHMIREVGRYRSDDDEYIIGQLWETDRGDYYITGETGLSDGEISEHYSSITNDSWRVPYDCPHESISGQGQLPDDNEEFPYDDDPDIPDDPIPDEQMPDENDTDNGLLSKIANNTGATAEGVSRLNEYASALLSAVNNMDRNISSIKQNTSDIVTNTSNIATNTGDIATNTGDIATNTGEIATNTGEIATNTGEIATDTGEIATNTGEIATNTGNIATDTGEMASSLSSIDEKLDSDEAASSKAEMDGLNPSDYYNSSNFSGDLVEGSDYEAIEPLSDSEWYSGFLASNPYKNALDNSGFQMTNATCEMTLSLPVLGGSYDLSICEFDSAFTAAGTLLLSLTTLGGFILLVRG